MQSMIYFRKAGVGLFRKRAAKAALGNRMVLYKSYYIINHRNSIVSDGQTSPEISPILQRIKRNIYSILIAFVVKLLPYLTLLNQIIIKSYERIRKN